jgi:hypothetical protein
MNLLKKARAKAHGAQLLERKTCEIDGIDVVFVFSAQPSVAIKNGLAIRASRSFVL